MEIAVIGVAVLHFQNRFGLHRGAYRALAGSCAAHRHQAGGVVLARLVQDLLCQAFFYFFAVAQHFDSVGHLGHHGQVVGNV